MLKPTTHNPQLTHPASSSTTLALALPLHFPSRKKHLTPAVPYSPPFPTYPDVLSTCPTKREREKKKSCAPAGTAPHRTAPHHSFPLQALPPPCPALSDHTSCTEDSDQMHWALGMGRPETCISDLPRRARMAAYAPQDDEAD